MFYGLCCAVLSGVMFSFLEYSSINFLLSLVLATKDVILIALFYYSVS